MASSFIAKASIRGNRMVPNEASRSLEDGGSSLGLTQGEIIFVTLACFVVAIASIFAIYTIYTKRRQAASARQSNNLRNSAVVSPVIKLDNGMNQQTQGVGNSMVSRESIRQYSRGNSMEEDRARRASLDSVDSTGRKQSRRRSTESAASNVSSQYKVAAIDHMRRMSDAAER